ncbi:hypothetical protein Mpsy_1878 [Methanolobus psychrophilus R15]|nr:hypothetical protein Mpsy_1878 [Methanolobus psychrophilus R15]
MLTTGDAPDIDIHLREPDAYTFPVESIIYSDGKVIFDRPARIGSVTYSNINADPANWHTHEIDIETSPSNVTMTSNTQITTYILI